jgi:8-oxo-dGTP diphosphatase
MTIVHSWTAALHVSKKACTAFSGRAIKIAMRSVVSQGPGPTPLDRTFQVGYAVAYRLMRAYWGIRRPVTHGALIALWNAGEVLLVRNSYIPYYSAPGGYVRHNEAARDAAARELAEEVGIRVSAERLEFALEVTHDWENKRDHVQLFNLELSERPVVRIDHREVIEAAWFAPEHAVTLNVFPPLKKVIEAKL